MKKFLLIAAAAFMAFSCGPKTSTYSVKIEADSTCAEIMDSALVTISTVGRDTVNVIKDTTVMANGVAVFEGTIAEPDMVFVSVKTSGDEVYEFSEAFFLENANYEFTIEKKEVKEGAPRTSPFKFVHKLIGGKLQSVKDSLNAKIEEIRENMGAEALIEKFYAAYAEKNDALTDSIYNEYGKIENEIKKVEDSFYSANPTSPVTIYNHYRNANDLTLDSLKAVITTLEADANAAAYKYTNKLKEVFAKRDALAPGKQAPDFTLEDVDGNPVKFSEVYPKNKITMIDFWASWCSPCRRFNPTLTKIYAKYKDKGFGILGVSLDREKEPWLKAIEDDKLVWQHVSDIKGWECAAAQLYNIHAIPNNYLVDSEGKILAGNDHELDLEKFLEENLK